MTEIKTIGILGGGQLGRMLALKAYDLGFRCVIWDESKEACALKVTENAIVAPYTDKAKMKEFINKIDVAVLEFENIPVGLVKEIEKTKLVIPSSKVLSVVQDRVEEKKFFDENGIPCAPWHLVDSEESAKEAGAKLGYPLILKTARFGYDGKGQIRVISEVGILSAWHNLDEAVCIAEAVVNFDREISIIGVRNLNKKTAVYDISENMHKDHILHTSIVPANVSMEASMKAKRYLEKALKGLDIVGLLALEMFVIGDEVIANEMAARPHNSGHWTMDGAKTSQFEQCIKVALNLRLGSCKRTTDVKMQNMLGDDILSIQVDNVEDYAEIHNYREISIHCYGKKEIRYGRKMGHINYLSKKTEKSE